MKFLIIFILFFGCAFPRKHKDMYNTINLNREGTENVDISINKSDPKYNEKLEKERREKKKISLTLLPSIYHSLAIIDLLRRIEKEDIEIASLHSFGFGSLILSLYAKEKSASYLEWKLFSLVKSIKGQRPYGPEWKNNLMSFANEEFKNLKISELQIQISPLVRNIKELYNQNKNMKVVEFLDKSLDLENEKGFFNSKLDYIEERNDHLKYTVAYIGEPVQVTKLNGLHFGIFTQYLGRLMQSTFTEDGIYVLRAKAQVALDEVSSTSELTNYFNDKNTEMMNTIIGDYTNDQEDQESNYYNY